MNHSYRGWTVSFNRLDRLWYAWDSSQHIAKTRVTARSAEEIKTLVDERTPNYKPPAFAWMAA
jgi:hypothetical protein